MYKEEKTKQVATITEKKSKNIINKRVIFGVACVTVVLLGAVGVAIFTKSKDSEEILDESELLVTEKDTYEGLNYIETKEQIEKKSFFYDLDRNLEGSKIDVSYISVSGLKDSSIETKINEKLRDAAIGMYDGTSLGNSNVLYEHIYNYTDVYIFNNVVSTMYCREFCDIEGNISYEYSSINLNLTNFESIDFKDIFIDSANLDDIVSEDEKAKIEEGSIIFSISPKNIYIANGDKINKISLYDNIDKVAIYKRFANNKKLFNKTYSAKPYVFTTKNFYETDNYGLVESNLFIDTFNIYAKKSLDYSNEVLEKLNDLYKESVNKAKNLSYSNPSKRYIVQLIPKVKEEEDGYFKLSVIYTCFEINKEFFNQNIEKFVVASENKSDEELALVQYFNNPVMDAENYLLKTNNEILEKIVDKDGNEKKELKNEKDNTIDTNNQYGES